MKKCTPKLQVIPATIYPCNIYIFKGFTYKQAVPDLDGIYKEHWKYLIAKNFDNPGFTVRFPDGSIVILIHKDHVDDMSIVTHECFHATEFIMDYVHTPLTESTSEPYAYLLGYIVNEIIR